MRVNRPSLKERIRGCIPGDPTDARLEGPDSIQEAGTYVYHYIPRGEGAGPFVKPPKVPDEDWPEMELILADKALAESGITWTTAGSHLTNAEVLKYKDKGKWYNNKLSFIVNDDKYPDTCAHIFGTRKNGATAYKMLLDERDPEKSVSSVKAVLTTGADKYNGTAPINDFIHDTYRQSYLWVSGGESQGLNSVDHVVEFDVVSTDFPGKVLRLVQPIGDDIEIPESTFLAVSARADAPLLNSGSTNKLIEVAGLEFEAGMIPPVKIFTAEFYNHSDHTTTTVTVTVALIVREKLTREVLATTYRQFIFDKQEFKPVPPVRG